MKVRDISLPNIIKVRMDFCKGYEKELTNTAAGEEKAYTEMLDAIDCKLRDFYCRFIHVLAQCQNPYADIDEITAYAGVMGEVLEIINPYFHYETSLSELVGHLPDHFTKDYSISDIIRGKEDFVKNNRVFNAEEYLLCNVGGLKAYDEMLEDLDMETDSFIEKYAAIVYEISRRIEQETEDEDHDIDESLIGYNNAVLGILELLDFKYKFGV